jgi:hypothetical protein
MQETSLLHDRLEPSRGGILSRHLISVKINGSEIDQIRGVVAELIICKAAECKARLRSPLTALWVPIARHKQLWTRDTLHSMRWTTVCVWSMELANRIVNTASRSQLRQLFQGHSKHVSKSDCLVTIRNTGV